jgi:sugar/nucleoside kinase (ribokinase family)
MKSVFVAGGATFDKIICLEQLPEPKPGTVFSKCSYDTIGSTGCGKALSLQRLGLDTTFHAMIGADRSGDFIKGKMKEEGIRFIYDIDPAGTEEHVNLMDDSGNRMSVFTKYATFEPELNLNKFDSIIAKNDYIVINIINYARRLIPIVKKYKKEIWCDIHDYDGTNEYHKDFIEAADYIFMSSDHMKDYRRFMEQMIVSGKKLVVCTHGKQGASALSPDGQFIEIPILDDYKRIDTNGAGDNFFSGFLYGFSKGFNLIKCLQYGTITAGLCVNSTELVNPNLNEKTVEQEYKMHYNQGKV